VTHDQREALTMSDRIVVINHGKLVQIDTPKAIYNKPANAFVADFVGESTILPLESDGNGNLQFENQLIQSNSSSTGEWSLVIRPERLFVIDDGVVIDSNKSVAFSGTLRDFVFQGETAFVVMTMNNGQHVSFRFGTDSSSTENALQAGQTVVVGLKRQDIIVIPRDKNQ
jgi:putative spermidine/putrescine transport system ATP-binding protein